jgi:hypothetical protein
MGHAMRSIAGPAGVTRTPPAQGSSLRIPRAAPKVAKSFKRIFCV